MKIFLTLITLVFALSAQAELTLKPYEKNPKSETSIKNLTSLISKQKLEEDLRALLSESRPSRLWGTEGNLKAHQWLLSAIKKADPKSRGNLLTQDFSPDILKAKDFYAKEFKNELEGKVSPSDPSYIRWNQFTNDVLGFLSKNSSLKAQNIIWQKKGYINPDELLILTANLDTLTIDSKNFKLDLASLSVGADNNASGVTVALELIELLTALDLPKSVWVVFTDVDELAFSGTNAFLEKYDPELKKMKSVSQASLVMLGYDSKSKDKEKKYGNMSLYFRKASEPGHALDKKLATQMTKERWDNTVNFSLVPNGFNSTGHSLFWERGYPAVVFTQNWESDLNPHEHTSNDIAEILNMNTLYGSYRFIAGATLAWTLDL